MALHDNSPTQLSYNACRLRDENALLKQQLERKRQENQQLKENVVTLQRGGRKHCIGCHDKDTQLEDLRKEVHTYANPCRRPECADACRKASFVDTANANVERHLKLLKEKQDELSSTKVKLQHANLWIQQMERISCSCAKCNEHAKRLLSVFGDKLQIGCTEVSVTETLQHVEKKLDMLLDISRQTGPSNAATLQGGHWEEEYKQLQDKLESLQHGPCKNDACAREKDSLHRKVEELKSQLLLQHGPCKNDACAREKGSLHRKVEELKSQLRGPKCQRPECVRLREGLVQKQVAEVRQGRSIGKDMEKITGGEYAELIQRFEDLTTSTDGLLGQLENEVDQFQAKLLVSQVFKFAYTRSKMAVIEAIKIKLETLFALNKKAPKEEMEDASRGYGRLLHASGLKANQAAYVASLTQKIRSQLESSRSPGHSIFQKIFQKQPSTLGEVVKLAWEMVTLPSPLVISEPDAITEQTHDREFGYWDPSVTDAQLIYLRPVVYRSYQGDLACKAWVANSKTQVPFQPPPSGPHQNPQAGAGGFFSSALGWAGLN